MTALEGAKLKELWKERVENFRTSGLSGRQWWCPVTPGSQATTQRHAPEPP